MSRRFSFTIQDKDLGFNDLLETAEELKKSKSDYVAVGILSKDAGQEQDGTKLIDIAVWNEFGTSRIPSRPFIRQTFDKEKAALKKSAQILSNKMGDGVLTKKAALEILGDTFVGKIRRSIENREFQANAESTIRMKGSDKPLVSNGDLQKAIKYEVR